MDKIEIRKKASATLLRYAIIKPTLDDLVHIAEDYGYEIIDFDADIRSGSLEILVSKLSLQSQVKNSTAFTFHQGNIRLIFLREDLNASEKLYALAHELGHIICGHIDHRTLESQIEEEREANEFAHYLLDDSVFCRLRVWSKVNASRIVVVAYFALLRAI